MNLTLINLTDSPLTYLSGTISVPATGSLEITDLNQQFLLSTDGTLYSDIYNILANVSDGTNTYQNTDAIAYLRLIPFTSSPVMAQYNASLPTLTDTQQNVLQLDSRGRLVTTLVPEGGYNSGSGTISASGIANVVKMNTQNCNTLFLKITGTWVGTWLVVGTNDDFTTTMSLAGNSGTAVFNSATSNQSVIFPCGGYSQVGIYFLFYTSGTLIATWSTSPGLTTIQAITTGSATFQTRSQIADGQSATTVATVKAASTAASATDTSLVVGLSPNSPIPTGSNVIGSVNQGTSPWVTADAANGSVVGGTAGTKSMLAGAQFNTALPTLTDTQQAAIQADANGRVIVSNAPLDGYKATYSATSAIGFAAAASATDIFTITGSASKTIRVLRIGISGTRTTATNTVLLLIKRSSANSGGTSASATAVPHDSDDGAATATVLNYTANPSLGNAVGTIKAIVPTIPTTTSVPAAAWIEFTFGDLPEKAIILRGTSEVLALNLNATSAAGSALTCFVEWSEET